MDWTQFSMDLHLVWQYKPGVIILLGVGFLVFLFLVADVCYCKAKERRQRPAKKWVLNFRHETRKCRRPSAAIYLRTAGVKPASLAMETANQME
jgi:hypothetical protein